MAPGAGTSDAGTAGQLLPAGTRLGAVHLAVTDAERALRFWTGVLGLAAAPGGGAGIPLAAGGPPLVVLHPGAARPVARGRTGLYHLALHLPSRRELARAVARLLARRWPNSPTDHVTTETTYLADPDGNGIELTFETPERGRLVALPDGRYAARAPDGTLLPGVAALDVDGLLATLGPGEPLDAPLGGGTRVGHVHLHVADRTEAFAWYRDVVGFRPLLDLPVLGMADLGLDRSVPHALALNVWAGQGAPPPPPDSAGLRHFTVELPAPDALERVAARVRASGQAPEPIPRGLRALDPSGNAVHLVT